MFYDMALLVDEQGEMIDRIEHNVENAAVHVDVGRKEIRVAVQFQRKNRRVSFGSWHLSTDKVVLRVIQV